MRAVHSAVAAALMGLAAAAQGQTGVSFGLVSLADGQGLRVQVLNLGSRGSTPTSSCEVTVRFLDTRGESLRDSTVTVTVGQGAAVELRRAQASSKPGRVAARAVLQFGLPVGGAPLGLQARQQFDCNIVPTLEVVDEASGRATAVLTDTKPLPVPDPRSIN